MVSATRPSADSWPGRLLPLPWMEGVTDDVTFVGARKVYPGVACDGCIAPSAPRDGCARRRRKHPPGQGSSVPQWARSAISDCARRARAGSGDAAFKRTWSACASLTCTASEPRAPVGRGCGTPRSTCGSTTGMRPYSRYAFSRSGSVFASGTGRFSRGASASHNSTHMSSWRSYRCVAVDRRAQTPDAPAVDDDGIIRVGSTPLMRKFWGGCRCYMQIKYYESHSRVFQGSEIVGWLRASHLTTACRSSAHHYHCH